MRQSRRVSCRLEGTVDGFWGTAIKKPIKKHKKTQFDLMTCILDTLGQESLVHKASKTLATWFFKVSKWVVSNDSLQRIGLLLIHLS